MPALEYLKDPQAIYDTSFATVRAEADLSCLPISLESIAVRMIHACGMTDLAEDLRFDLDIIECATAALKSGAPVFADCEAVSAAITRKFLPMENEIICTLNDAPVPALAKNRATTRSAAAITLWTDRLEGAVVVIGNAPTALFALLEVLDEGAGSPAAIIATPVGFVGAAESKAELAHDARGVPFLTLLGRRGGSAMAVAAFNAIARGTKS